MPKTVKIIKTNVKEILQSLSQDQLGRAVMAGAFVFEGAAKMLTPIDTGNLVNSINTELVSSDETSATAEVGTGVEYAPHVEYGTSKMKAQPFFRPAWDEKLETIKATIQRFAKKQIEQAAD
jgi:HK97 gp10 family phage protein